MRAQRRERHIPSYTNNCGSTFRECEHAALVDQRRRSNIQSEILSAVFVDPWSGRDTAPRLRTVTQTRNRRKRVSSPNCPTALLCSSNRNNTHTRARLANTRNCGDGDDGYDDATPCPTTSDVVFGGLSNSRSGALECVRVSIAVESEMMCVCVYIVWYLFYGSGWWFDWDLRRKRRSGSK